MTLNRRCRNDTDTRLDNVTDNHADNNVTGRISLAGCRACADGSVINRATISGYITAVDGARARRRRPFTNLREWAGTANDSNYLLHRAALGNYLYAGGTDKNSVVELSIARRRRKCFKPGGGVGVASR